MRITITIESGYPDHPPYDKPLPAWLLEEREQIRNRNRRPIPDLHEFPKLTPEAIERLRSFSRQP